MSFFSYISSSVELPTGSFAVPPKLVYDSYDAYYHSPDYIPRKEVLEKHGSEAYAHFEEMNCRMPGKVVIDIEPSIFSSAYIKPLRFEGSDAEMMTLFRYPYNYIINGNAEMAYLRSYLPPDAKADYLYIFEGHGTQGYANHIHRTLKLEEATDDQEAFKQIHPAHYARDMVPFPDHAVVELIPLAEPLIAPELLPNESCPQVLEEELLCVIRPRNGSLGTTWRWRATPYPRERYIYGNSFIHHEIERPGFTE